MTPSYAELCLTTNFTFLTGASHPQEYVEEAFDLRLKAIAITDRNTLAGVVRAFQGLKDLSDACWPGEPLPKLIVGARLVLTDSPVDWLALPMDREAYARLSRLLTTGKRRAEKGQCHLTESDLREGCAGMILIARPPDPLLPETGAAAMAQQIAAMREAFGDAVYLGAAPAWDGQDQRRLKAYADLSKETSAPMVAVGDVLMHQARRKPVADVLTCLREGLTIDKIGKHALPNAERRLKGAADMARVFAEYRQAIARTLEIADRCTFSMDELRYEYPDEVTEGEDPQARLERLTEDGLRWRYPDGVPQQVRGTVAHELRLIRKLDYAPYFLTVEDVVRFARSRGILCQGRGSAANSVVCYALGITEASPDLISMVFERFVSEARDEPPDIDVDFEHERREEVIQYLYGKYGRHRAGLCATVIHFRARAAIREVGKVMGLSADLVSALAGQIWGWSDKGLQEARIRELGLDPGDRRLRQTLWLVRQIIGFPRHLSQHVGGFVITRGRLDELVPIENAAMDDRTVIEWDKDDIDTLGLMKVDVLALGMLTCMRKGLDLLKSHYGPDYSLDTLPKEDGAVYDMLCKADSLGVFQVESRAQMNFLPRMKPRNFYDLVIEVAIIRPGPIQGDMVHPYIRRRNGEEPVEFPSEQLRDVLGKTLGVPLFQEQAMKIAMVAADFTAEEADRLRRSLATFRRTGTISSFRERFISGMIGNGYDPAFAERCFSQIEGFGEYGFPESHAASFAVLVYASAWLKCHYPVVFAAALLNSQPMGFYAPAQIVRDAREHGVEVRPVSVNHSYWDCTLEPKLQGDYALRLGFRQIKGIGQDDAGWIAAARGNGYPDVESLWRRAGVAPRTLTRLAEADAFACLSLTRREALWHAKAIKATKPLPLFAQGMEGEGMIEPAVQLPAMPLGEEVVEDYVTMRLSLKAHPLELLRSQLRSLQCNRLNEPPNNTGVTVSGLVITRQRPGTASGVIFITLEDESGIANIIVWPKTYERFRRAVIAGRLLTVRGKLQRENGVTHIIAWDIRDDSPRLATLGQMDRNGQFHPSNPRSDEARRPVGPDPRSHHSQRTPPRPRHPREQAKVLFPSRDFH